MRCPCVPNMLLSTVGPRLMSENLEDHCLQPEHAGFASKTAHAVRRSACRCFGGVQSPCKDRRGAVCSCATDLLSSAVGPEPVEKPVDSHPSV